LKISLNSIIVKDYSISWQNGQISICMKMESIKKSNLQNINERMSFSIISSISQECVLEEEEILCIIYNHKNNTPSNTIELVNLTIPFSF